MVPSLQKRVDYVPLSQTRFSFSENHPEFTEIHKDGIRARLWNSVSCHIGDPGFAVAISAAWVPGGRMVPASLSTISPPLRTPKRSLGCCRQFYLCGCDVFCPHPTGHVNSHDKFWLITRFPNYIKITTKDSLLTSHVSLGVLSWNTTLLSVCRSI